jgi:hypothetical protein
MAMTRVEVDMETATEPKVVFDAFLDFSERRPALWPNLAEKYYKVHGVGENTADVTEGSGFPFNIWAREHYEWDREAGMVKWAAAESNFCTPGSGAELTIRPREGGGSLIHVAWQREPTTAKGRFLIKMIAAGDGKRLKGFMQKSVDGLNERMSSKSNSA